MCNCIQEITERVRTKSVTSIIPIIIYKVMNFVFFFEGMSLVVRVIIKRQDISNNLAEECVVMTVQRVTALCTDPGCTML